MPSSGSVDAIVEDIAIINPYTNAKDLPHVPRPEESSIPQHLTPLLKIPHVQRLINELKYNFLPRTFFPLDKHRSLQSILLSSKDILSAALPIRCLEATFLGLYLTQSLKGIDRIPLSFKSRINGRTYHHIVLVVRCKALYGALGLSRKPTLMDKEMTYRSLYDLVMEYKKQYEAIGHRLVDCKLGLCVSHDVHCKKPPCWRYIVVRFDRSFAAPAPRDDDDGPAASPTAPGADDVAAVLARFADLLPVISEQYDRYAATARVGVPRREAHPVPLRDLDGLDDDDARAEGRRRIAEIREGRSPCTLPAMAPKKRAASRSVSKARGAFRIPEQRDMSLTTPSLPMLTATSHEAELLSEMMENNESGQRLMSLAEGSQIPADLEPVTPQA